MIFGDCKIQFKSLFSIILMNLLTGFRWANPNISSELNLKPKLSLQSVGSRIKMGFNKTQSIMDTRPFSEVKLKTGERLFWNQSGNSAYQVKGAGNEVLSRTNNSNAVNQNKIKMRGTVDAGALARYQGRLAEAQARINITQARIDGLQLKQSAGMATAKDLRTLKSLRSNMPKYQKAYRGLESRTTLSGSSLGRTVKAGFSGALTAAGIHAGISLLSDTIDHDGDVNISRALSYMAQPNFLGGITGGTIGAMMLSSLPVPGVAGGLLKALPMFMGGAIGFEVGSGNVENVNWVRLIGSTTASAAAFGLIGGPIGIAASILAGMVVDQLFESPEAGTQPIGDPFVPDWGQIAANQQQGAQMMSLPAYVPGALPQGQAGEVAQMELSDSRENFNQAGQSSLSVEASNIPKAPQLQSDPIKINADSPDVVQLTEEMRIHYDRYVKAIKNKDAKSASLEFERYKAISNQIQMMRSINRK